MSTGKLILNALSGVCTIAVTGIIWVTAVPEPPPSEIADLGDGSIEADEPAAAEKPRDLVLITIDTLRADRLGMYGHEDARTPNLDRLARRGMKFEHSTVAFPRTTPAMASLFTGLWPHHHGSREVWEPIREGTMLTEVLKKAGFATAGISSNAACAQKQHFDRGFDTFFTPKDLGRGENANRVTDRAIEVLDAADPEQPLFLWVHYIDPHWKYRPPSSFKDQPKAAKCRKIQQDLKSDALDTGQVLSNHNNLSKDALDDCQALYDAEVAFADAEIGRLIDRMKYVGRFDDALIVFTSDHGENMGEDGYWFGHGPSVHEAAMRVPLVISGPGIPRGRIDSSVTRGEDVMPTILELLEIPPGERPKTDGKAFTWRWDKTADLPKRPVKAAFAESGTPLRYRTGGFLVTGNKRQYCVNDGKWAICRLRDDDTKAYVEGIYDREVDPFIRTPLDDPPEDVKQRLEAAMETWKPETARQRTVRTKTHKLVHYPRLSGGYDRKLFNLRKDPGQTTDVIDQEPKVAKALEELLQRWLADVPLYEARERTSEELEELRSLGYMGN